MNFESNPMNSILNESELKQLKNPQEDQPMYNVEKIINKKIIKGKVLYRVKWEGYPIEQNTWEPIINLENVQGLINEYEAKIEAEKILQEIAKNKHIMMENQKSSMCKFIVYLLIYILINNILL